MLQAPARKPLSPIVSAPPAPGGHHRGDAFQNNYDPFDPKSLTELLRWRHDAARHGLPPAPAGPTPQVGADPPSCSATRPPAAMAPAVTWIGHASALAQLGGLTFLTDPVFSERASPLSFGGPRRHVAAGIALADLPRIDVVLISHNHYDHLDAASVRSLAAQAGGPPLFLVPLGIAAWLAAARHRRRDRARLVAVASRIGATEIVLLAVAALVGPRPRPTA